MKQLKYHEKKLLKKTDFFNWKTDTTLRVSKLLNKYYVQNPSDIKAYEKLVGQVKKLVNRLKILKKDDDFRVKQTSLLLKKLERMGLIKETDSLLNADQLSASCFARRRLAYMLFKNKYCETLKEAVTFIEQGHVRVGTELVTDPAYHVTRYTVK